MAIAKICDRCGNVYAKNTIEADFGDNKYGTVRGVIVMFEETDRRLPTYNEDDTRKNAYMDLCDSCATDIVSFLLKDKK